MSPTEAQIPASIAGFVSDSAPRAPYKHACKGKFQQVPAGKRNAEPYSKFSLRSNAAWFQNDIDGRPTLVANTMFDPAELGALCAACVEAKVDRVEIAIFAPVAKIPEVSAADPLPGSDEEIVG